MQEQAQQGCRCDGTLLSLIAVHSCGLHTFPSVSALVTACSVAPHKATRIQSISQSISSLLSSSGRSIWPVVLQPSDLLSSVL
jgi:hypothetical protein